MAQNYKDDDTSLWRELLRSYDDFLRQDPINFLLSADEHVSHDTLLWAFAYNEREHEAHDYLLDLDPHRADKHYFTSEQIVRSRQYDEALALYERVSRRVPRIIEAYVGKGRALNALAEYDGAVAHYTLALEFATALVAIYCDLAEVSEEVGLHKLALEAADEAIKLFPGTELTARAYRCKIQALDHLDKQDEAQALRDQLRRYGETPQEDARAQYMHVLKRYGEDLDYYAHELERQPREIGVYLRKGALLEGMQWYNEALATYEEALKVAAANVQVHIGKGRVLKKRNQPIEALVAFEQARQYEPDNANIHIDIGEMLLLLGRYPEAIAAFEQALLHDAGNPDALSGRRQALVASREHNTPRESLGDGMTRPDACPTDS
ncbi:MAG TPA: tetratricopeptide repeat protein [Ktedonobacteraceae bacterium]|jgi:tetratricopeptide (TPR) repeat protein|nr:tetratricopeptide repeat protein [Ktedonobacteraceae bacterium]